MKNPGVLVWTNFKTTPWYRNLCLAIWGFWECTPARTAESFFLYWACVFTYGFHPAPTPQACFWFWIWELHWISLICFPPGTWSQFPSFFFSKLSSSNSLMSPSEDFRVLYVVNMSENQVLRYGWRMASEVHSRDGGALVQRCVLLVGRLEKACASFWMLCHPLTGKRGASEAVTVSGGWWSVPHWAWYKPAASPTWSRAQKGEIYEESEGSELNGSNCVF